MVKINPSSRPEGCRVSYLKHMPESRNRT